MYSATDNEGHLKIMFDLDFQGQLSRSGDIC